MISTVAAAPCLHPLERRTSAAAVHDQIDANIAYVRVTLTVDPTLDLDLHRRVVTGSKVNAKAAWLARSASGAGENCSTVVRRTPSRPR